MTDSNQLDRNSEQLLRLACKRVEELVQLGVPDAASTVLRENPSIGCHEESAIEVIYAQFLAMEETGRVEPIEWWFERFPTYRTRLERLLKLHDLLSTDEPAGHNSTISSRISSPDTQAIPRTSLYPSLEGYQLFEELGRGGMGIVYRAKQNALGRIVAVKVLRSIENHPSVRSRFQTEAETVASLQHPNIVQVIEISLADGAEFLSMEYLGGGSLEQRLSRTESWSNHEKAKLLQTLAIAIHYAHERGIIHRDLKPANILFTESNIPKIVDFGLAKRYQAESQQTKSGDFLGTPCYMSPEQATGSERPIGPTTDIYSLGVILYQFLTGRLPFEGKTALETLRWISDRECEPPTKWVRDVPRDLETICLKCLAKDPSSRYTTANELAEDLGRFLDHRPILARRLSPWERGWRLVRRHPQVSALAGSIAVVLIGSILLLYMQRQSMDQLAKEKELQQQSADSLRKRAGEAEGAYEASLQKARDIVKQWAQVGVRLDNEPGMDGLRRKAFEDAVTYYEEFLQKEPVDEAIRFEATEAAIRCAHMHMDLALWDQAERELRLADRWLEKVNPSSKQKWFRSDVSILLGHVLRRVERWDESEESYLRAIAMVDKLIEDNPTNTLYLMRQSNAMVNLCVVYKSQKRWDDSLNTYLRSLRMSTRASLTRVRKDIPSWLLLGNELPASSSERDNEMERLIDYWNELCRDKTPANTECIRLLAKEGHLAEIALCLDDTSQVLEYLHVDSLAERCVIESVSLRKLSKELFPANRRIDQYLARGQANLGSMYLSSNRLTDACEILSQADQIYTQLTNDFPERSDYKNEWSNCLRFLARCKRAQHEIADAIATTERCIRLDEVNLKQQPTSLAAREQLATSVFQLAFYLDCKGDSDRSEKEYRRACTLSKDRPAPANSYAWMISISPSVQDRQLERAIIHSEIAVQLAPQNGNYWNTHALALVLQGEAEKANVAVSKAMQLANGGSVSDWFIQSMVFALRQDRSSADGWFMKAESIRTLQSPNNSELQRLSDLARERILRIDSTANRSGD